MDKLQKPSVLALVKQAGMLRPRDLDQYGIPREYLSRLRNRGLLRQVGRGLYTLPDAEWTAHHSLAEACKRVPRGVICLLSALQFHELTTQLPFQVWMAIPNKARQPKWMDYRFGLLVFQGLPLMRASKHIPLNISRCGSTTRPKPWQTASNTGTKSVWMWLLRACEIAFENGKPRWMTSITSHKSVG